MRDIRPTEADREEAILHLEKLAEGKPGSGEWHGINDKWTDEERIAIQCEHDSRIRADAVKAERERLTLEITTLRELIASERVNYDRREQEARADERRRCAVLARRKVREWQMTRTIPKVDADELYTAILQGTEPAEYVESKEDRDERLRVKQELGAGCHDEMRYNEPAKVSEDVERDIEAVHSSLDVLRGILDSLDTSGDCYTSEDAIQAIGALYRLVSRIKEGEK